MSDNRNRLRPKQIKFFVNDKEYELIRKKMAQMGTDNMSAYLRKMAIDGYVVNLDMPELRELTSKMKRINEYPTAKTRLPNNSTQRVTSTKRTSQKSKRIRKKFTKALKKSCFLFPI